MRSLGHEPAAHCRSLGFGNEQLQERGCVDVPGHALGASARRSSRTVSLDTGAETGSGSNSEDRRAGCTRPPAIATAMPLADDGGTNTATNLPLLVTPSDSPPATRTRAADACCWRSRTEIISMCVNRSTRLSSARTTRPQEDQTSQRREHGKTCIPGHRDMHGMHEGNPTRLGQRSTCWTRHMMAHHDCPTN